MALENVIQIVSNEIALTLDDNKPSIYIYGSFALNDFKLGWSDIDIFVFTEKEISEEKAKVLVELRQQLDNKYSKSSYFNLFEGGITQLDAFIENRESCSIYWGTTGQKVINLYTLDSFGIAEIIDNGILVYGKDIRNRLNYPTYTEFKNDIILHTKSAREYGGTVGWLLDISRGIYTLRTGKIISKTRAGEWALENMLCPNIDALKKAVEIRKNPLLFSETDKMIDNDIIQEYADVLMEDI